MSDDIEAIMSNITDHPNFIKELEIRNFKSIRHAKLKNKRINVFIGEPNTGKSNILEVFGLLSAIGHRDLIANYIRVSNYDQLYYNEFLDKLITISIQRNDGLHEIVDIKYDKGKHTVKVNEIMKGWMSNEKSILQKQIEDDVFGQSYHSFSNPESDYGEWYQYLGVDRNFNSIKYYKFRDFHLDNLHKKEKYEEIDAKNEKRREIEAKEIQNKLVLQPPKGENIYFVVNNSEKNQIEAKELFRDFDMKLHLVKFTERVEAQKEINGVVKSYPLLLLADTVQSLLFYYMAIKSNNNSIIILEEPEAHTFPTHTQELAMKIVDDKKNQYFIATHNPYVLHSLIEKEKDVQVNFVRHNNGTTEVKQLDKNQLSFLINRQDIFAALTHYDDWPEQLRSD